jgi:uncharacterized protein
MDSTNTSFIEKKDHIPHKRQIVLMVSQTCNLNCRYCYETRKTSGLMTVATAKEILEREFSTIRDDARTTHAEIAFMGGEPLLNFDLVRSISEWIWSKDIALPYEITIRTNGTLLDRGMRDWFILNRERIKVGLSMDGISEMNRMNRTSEKIDYRFFHENWPGNRVKIVLHRDTVAYLARTVREMNGAGLPFEVEIGEGFEWTSDDADALERQLVELIPLYLSEREEAIASGLFSYNQADYFPADPMTDIAFCGKSNNIIAYDVDGSPCVCHLFSTPVQGYENARRAWRELRDIPKVRLDPYCVACPVQKVCKTCFGENMRLFGTIYKSAARDTICKAVKAKARACAYYYLKCVEEKIEGGKALSTSEREMSHASLRLLETVHTREA